MVSSFHLNGVSSLINSRRVSLNILQAISSKSNDNNGNNVKSGNITKKLNKRDRSIDSIINQIDFARSRESELIPLSEDPSLPMIKTIIMAADKRKANYITAMRISHLTEVTTFMVVIEGTSRPQNQAIALSVEEDVLIGYSEQPSKQGNAASGWIVLDYGSVIVHVMTPQMRNFYKLERRWKDSEVLDLTDILLPSSNSNRDDLSTDGFVEDGDEDFEDEDEGVDNYDVEKDDDPFWQ